MPHQAYSLVKFYEQGLWQCAVISSSWIEGNCAIWPKVHSKDFYKAVHLHLEPSAGSMKLTCEVIQTYDNFKKALEHKKKFQYTSGLNTSDVTVQMGRNHLRRKQDYRACCEDFF
ncbi:hypothetical protein T265_07867 [Opisthorchis viverrini]|uniref:Uncharacterized protein n=1 Tax=Opisthorchis viverrini TaxID=6198 RepID=A0A074ZB30_OPIVI|nr:hypothetical protein T265_07867 [Opisthorchis viverrini]KER24506.1 hypothetical protein T265_07867 [Opisthorchis viverrini]